MGQGQGCSALGGAGVRDGPRGGTQAVTGMKSLEETAGEGLEGAARAKGLGWGGTSHV